MVLLNEKKYVMDILAEKTVDPKKIYLFLGLYARYLYHENGFRKAKITRELNFFLQEHYPRYNPVDWINRIEKYADKADKYPLCECNGIWITERELQTIEALHDKVLERLSFTLLCLAKLANFKNPNNHNWVNYSNGEIYSMACINTTAFEKDIKYHQLRELGLIAYAKKINNLSIQVLYVDESSPNQLQISDFRKLGYEWRLYHGENYIRCNCCGILTRKNKGTTKYCSVCRKEKDLMRYKKYNEKRKANHTQEKTPGIPNP